MKKLPPLLLVLVSGLLLFAGWPPSPFVFLIFVAFVPLLWLEQQTSRGARFFGWTYLTLLAWNLATTWWVCNSTFVGGMAAILANSLLMCLPWILFRMVKKRMGAKFGYPALVVFWLTFEYIHLNWELSWPWLTLGNSFASRPDWVQWYEYTGTSGGSLWILLVNILVFRCLSPSTGNRRKPAAWLALSLTIPLALSLALKPSAKDSTDTTGRQHAYNVIIVQPNIDPYDEKFVAGSQEAQLQKLIRLSESKIDSATALVVWPETAVPIQINEDDMKSNFFMAPIWDFLRKHPSINLLTGVEGFRFYTAQNKTPFSSKVPESDKYEETYNSAMLMDSGSFQVYHKSKLVPGVETLPSFLRFMTPLFEKFGGTGGGYARQVERTVLNTTNHSFHIAPAVCYESIYGEFMTGYIRNDADLIAVITNDGWWGNTAGYKQHENYARLRAIETRRWVVRSANTGVSCFIDPSGKVIDPQPWDKTAVAKMKIPATDTMTFYTRHGDIISLVAIAGTILLIIWVLVLLTSKRSGQRQKNSGGNA